MGFLGVLVLSSLFAWLSAWLWWKFERMRKTINRIQGPTTLPLLGNLHQVRLNPDGQSPVGTHWLIVPLEEKGQRAQADQAKKTKTLILYLVLGIVSNF